MNCDVASYLCTINLGAMTIVFVLVVIGIITALYGALEGVLEWWYSRKDRGDKN
jgi:hypothetical protein